MLILKIRSISAGSLNFASRLKTIPALLTTPSILGNDDTIEKIRLSNPDYIFCAVGVKDQLSADNNFKNLKAVKNDRVFEIDSLLLNRQGNSLTEVLSFMIEMMYPELKSGAVVVHVDEVSRVSPQKQSSDDQESSEKKEESETDSE